MCEAPRLEVESEAVIAREAKSVPGDDENSCNTKPAKGATDREYVAWAEATPAGWIVGGSTGVCR